MRIRRRTAGGWSGAEPITLQSVETYSRLTGLRFTPWEVRTIEDIDDIYLASQATEENDKPTGD